MRLAATRHASLSAALHYNTGQLLHNIGMSERARCRLDRGLLCCVRGGNFIISQLY